MKLLRNLTVFIFLIVLFSCEKKLTSKNYTLQGAIFGTTYKIIYLNGAANYQESIDSLFLKMNTSLSTYIPVSDISKINAGDTSVQVDTLFKEVFFKAKRIFKETDGYFDPTVGNLVNAWGFGPKNEKLDLSKSEVTAQMELVGFNKVSLVNNTIIKENDKIYLDFNSIAKGFGIDVVARFLESKNIANYLVEIGGEIRTKGSKNENKPWTIKLVNPIESDTNEGFKILNLSNKSMATSGNYRKYRVADNGTKYVHTINPKTGYALESNLLSVSVFSVLDCADVDAYATAFMAMGLEKTKAFLKQHTSVSVILVFIDENGNLKEFTNYTEK